MDRNLVLLLTSGHTVKIALRPDDLADNTDGIEEVSQFVSTLDAVRVSPDMRSDVVMSFIEDMTQATIDEEPNDFQRIDAYAPGEAL